MTAQLESLVAPLAALESSQFLTKETRNRALQAVDRLAQVALSSGRPKDVLVLWHGVHLLVLRSFASPPSVPATQQQQQQANKKEEEERVGFRCFLLQDAIQKAYKRLANGSTSADIINRSTPAWTTALIAFDECLRQLFPRPATTQTPHHSNSSSSSSSSNNNNNNESSSSLSSQLTVCFRFGLVVVAQLVQIHQSTLAVDLLSRLQAFARCHQRTSFCKISQSMLAIIELTRNGDYATSRHAFEPFQEQNNSAADNAVGSFWNAIALLKNLAFDEAIDQLNKCIVANYKPFESLVLMAFLHVKQQDLFEAAETLERAMTVDFRAFNCSAMFDFALLLGLVGNVEAKQQMLEYVVEASEATGSRMASSSDLTKGTKRNWADANNLQAVHLDSRNQRNETPTIELFPGLNMSLLVGCAAPHVIMPNVWLHLAVCCLENGHYDDAQQHFEKVFPESAFQCGASSVHHHDYHHDGVVLAVPPPWKLGRCIRDYVFVLLQNNRPAVAMAVCQAMLDDDAEEQHLHELSDEDHVWLLFYQADALLCMEQVDECEQVLKQSIQPKLDRWLGKEYTADHQPERPAGVQEFHQQLLNNLAVVYACNNRIDEAIDLLRQCLRQHDASNIDTLGIAFNLVCLLWRQNQREAACSIWLDSRKILSNNDQDPAQEIACLKQKIVEITQQTIAQDPATTGDSAEHRGSHVVCVDHERGEVAPDQLLLLDTLILSHFIQLQRQVQFETSMNYLRYLEATTKPPVPPLKSKDNGA